MFVNEGDVFTLGSLPCLSMREMMVRMCCSLITFRASGESTNTQCSTSSTPEDSKQLNLLKH